MYKFGGIENGVSVSGGLFSSVHQNNNGTRGRGKEGNRRKKGKGHQGTSIKDPWTNQSGVGLRVGGGGRRGGGEQYSGWGDGDNCT